LAISLNLVLAGLRLGLKNRQVGEKWVSDDYSYLFPTVDRKMAVFKFSFSNNRFKRDAVSLLPVYVV
jgi:hypothetical protein